jgi:LPS sulfotransferase NodH
MGFLVETNHAKVDNYVILTRGRTGSTYFAETIGSQPGFLGFQENFAIGHQCNWYCHTNAQNECLSYMNYKDVTFDEYFSILTDHMKILNKEKISQKVLFNHLDENPGLEDFLISKSKIIHLSRNPFYEAVSGAYALSNDFWNSIDDESEAKRKQLISIKTYIEPQRILDEMSYSQHWNKIYFEKLSVFADQYLAVSYEKLLNNDPIQANALMRFLGLKEAMHFTYSKHSIIKYKEQVENWEDLVSIVRESKFASLLHGAF